MTESMNDLARAASLMINADDLDHIELAQLIFPYLTDQARSDLSYAIDLCPIHLIDIDICLDDQDPECAILLRADLDRD